MTMMMRSLARKGAIALCAVAVLAMMSGSGSARWHGCWGCGAFVAGAIAGAAIAVLTTRRAITTPPPWLLIRRFVVTPAPAPVVVTTPYPVCPAYGPLPYYSADRPRVPPTHCSSEIQLISAESPEESS